MRLIDTLVLRLRVLFRRGGVERELDAELRFHLEQQVAENQAAGMSLEEARSSAMRSLGSVAFCKEECRDSLGLRVVDEVRQDLRYALRQLYKNRGFTVVVLLTLALGIGANTTIFSVAHPILFQSLPYPESNRLVAIVPSQKDQPAVAEPISYPTFLDWQDQAHVFESMAAYVVAGSTLTGRGDPVVPEAAAVTPNLFVLLRVSAMVGRTLVPDDGRPGASPVVVITEQLWRDRLGQNPDIVGQSLTLDGRAHTIVGVMPASFRFPHANPTPQLWMPLSQFQPFQPLLQVRLAPLLSVVGRLKPESQLTEAQVEIEGIASRLAKEYPAVARNQIVEVRSLQERVVGDTRSSLLMLLGAVALLLLIACTNIASLQLARMVGRGREMAVRAALGAGGLRLFRQVLVESLLLTMAGGGLGLLVAQTSLQALTASIAPDLPQIRDIRIDRWVLGFTFVVSSATGVLFALLPAVGSRRVDVRAKLADGARTGDDRRQARTQNVLVVFEVALAVVMLTSAGLLIRSLVRLQAIDPGFNTTGLLTAAISLPQHEYSTPDQWRAFNAELLERIRRLPGVQGAAVGVGIPFIAVPLTLPFAIEGRPAMSGQPTSTELVVASPEFFTVMQIPLSQGRVFAESDTPDSPRTGIVNRAFAQRFFGDQTPVGATLLLGQPKPMRIQVVGVVGNTAQASLVAPQPPLLYVPFSQRPFWITSFVVRTAINPESVANAVRGEVAAMSPTVPVLGAGSMQSLLSRSFVASRHRTLLLGLLTTLALTLTAVGIYGTLAYTVARRTREIGIRMAVGAQPADVAGLVIRQGVVLTLVGVALGIAGAGALTRYLQTMLFGVTPLDVETFVAASVLFGVVAALASYMPVRRATKVDPLIALRCD